MIILERQTAAHAKSARYPAAAHRLSHRAQNLTGARHVFEIGDPNRNLTVFDPARRTIAAHTGVLQLVAHPGSDLLELLVEDFLDLHLDQKMYTTTQVQPEIDDIARQIGRPAFNIRLQLGQRRLARPVITPGLNRGLGPRCGIRAIVEKVWERKQDAQQAYP